MLVQAPAKHRLDEGRTDVFEGPSAAPTVVIDAGSCTTKYGFGGNSTPSELLSIVGRRRHVPMCLLGATYRPDTYVGSDVHGNEQFLNIRAPISGNEVLSWDDVEVIWHHIFYSKLKIDPVEHPMVLTTPAAGRSAKDNETLAILLFETFNAPRAFVAPPALLSLLSAGRSTGLVIDSGHAHTTCVPIYAGFPLAHATKSLPLGGREIAAHLGSILPGPTLEDDTLQEIKEKHCRAELDPFHAVAEGTWKGQEYALPDGKVVCVGTEAFRAPEPLFAPFLGLGDTVRRVIGTADCSVRKELWGSIVLSGGNVLLPGFADRLRQDLKAVASHDSTVSLFTPPDPKTAAWRGGSMLSGLSTFRDMCIPYSEYDEYGPVLLQRKCLGIGL